MQQTENYPYILKSLLENNQYENIVDSNILSAYIPHDFPIPQIIDPRKTQAPLDGVPRHPTYIRSGRINQIFNYIGFIKRIQNKEYARYLPMLFQELKRFTRVLEEIVYEPSISISEDIYNELEEGLQHFFDAFQRRNCDEESWVEQIWRQQKFYLEQIDMLVKTLKINGQVFDMKSDPLNLAIIEFCESYFQDNTIDPPEDTDVSFVANVCSKAALDNESKTIWSGDRHIYQILRVLYEHSPLTTGFPQIYLRASYLPFRFNQIFPD
jgi:hypothetical protein